MKAKTKALVVALCAVLLVVTTVFVTMAFLTSEDSVQNTFTVGNAILFSITQGYITLRKAS